MYLPGGPTLRPFHLFFGTISGARSGLNSGSGLKLSPASRSSSITRRAMAGEPARPGESIPAAWIRRGALLHASMILCGRQTNQVVSVRFR